MSSLVTPVSGGDGRCPVAQAVKFAEIENSLSELRSGHMIVIADDEDRENEGDLVIAAEMVTPEVINFMATHARGLICLAMTGERLDHLNLGPMVLHNTANLGTAFTVSIDARGRGVTTGISSYDRAQTILAAVDPRTRPEDLARPGHVFPLRSRPNGVLERRGQTEASVDLARLAGLHHAAVICEIMNRDGSMARGVRSGKVLLRILLHDGDCRASRSLPARNRIRPTVRPAFIPGIWARSRVGESIGEITGRRHDA